MTTVENRRATSLTVNYVGGSQQLTLKPGINLNIPADEWKLAIAHPVTKLWIDREYLRVLSKEPPVEGELEGFKVSTRDGDDQPVPHQDAALGQTSAAPVAGSPVGNLTLAEAVAAVTIRESESLINASTNVKELEALIQSDSRTGIKELAGDRLEELNG
jgi:hypothetical protein